MATTVGARRVAVRYAPGCVVIVDSRAPVRGVLSHDRYDQLYLGGRAVYPLMQPAIVVAVHRGPSYPATSRGTILGLVLRGGTLGWVISDDVYPSIVR